MLISGAKNVKNSTSHLFECLRAHHCPRERSRLRVFGGYYLFSAKIFGCGICVGLGLFLNFMIYKYGSFHITLLGFMLHVSVDENVFIGKYLLVIN